MPDRFNLLAAVGFLGREAAHQGNRAKAEAMFQLLETLPEPRPDLYRGEYLKHQAMIAIVLGDRDRAISLATRARLCCAPLGYLTRRDDPDIARYLNDSELMRALGLDKPDKELVGANRAPD